MANSEYHNGMSYFNAPPVGNGKDSGPGKGTCRRCGKWVGMALASCIGCGAIIAAPPAAGAAQVVVPVSHIMLHRLPGHDSEPEHPEGPDQTFDGPAALYSATAATSHLTISLPAARKLTPADGGAVSTSTAVSPRRLSPDDLALHLASQNSQVTEAPERRQAPAMRPGPRWPHPRPSLKDTGPGPPHATRHSRVTSPAT